VVHREHAGRGDRRAVNLRIPWFAIALLGSSALSAAALVGALPALAGVIGVVLFVLILLIRWGWHVLDCELL
jgi:protein-S-isoprenylcysteine O-methyltransferase Ste14